MLVLIEYDWQSCMFRVSNGPKEIWIHEGSLEDGMKYAYLRGLCMKAKFLRTRVPYNKLGISVEI